MKRRPYLTLVIAALALLIHLAGMDAWLQWTSAVTCELSSVLMYALTTFTAHLTHWHTEHLLWNVLTLVVLGAMIEQHTRWGLLACVMVSAAAIIAALQWMSHETLMYRGLSGIDSGLFVMAAVLMMVRATSKRSLILPGVALAAFAGKSLYECISGRLLFVSPDGFLPCPLSHVVGGCTGLLAAAVWLTHRLLKHELLSLVKCMNAVTAGPNTRRRQGHVTHVRSSHLSATE